MQITSRTLNSFERSAVLSYGIVLAAACKTIWGMWLYRDLTTGDTSWYFVNGLDWFKSFQNNVLWSPLYTMFYGQTLFATHSVYGATTLHRIMIVIAADVAVLAMMRRLMSPGLALLAALWWTILPINFNTLYEVHLFALLPMLVVLIVASSKATSLHRGIILALLVGITVLVRNEIVIATVIFASYCAYEDGAQLLKRGPRPGQWLKERVLPYAVPVCLVVTVVLVCYSRSILKFPELSAVSEYKHTLNMCQVYAFGYSQRHQEYTASPWTECMPLMKQVFGLELPSLAQMAKANPGATIRHFAWNLSLVFSGFQVALFNGMSGITNPDYAPVHAGLIYPALLSILVTVLLVGGGWKLRSQWADLKSRLIERRHLVVMYACMTCVVIVVVVTQRPRPSYLFSFTVCIIALVGMSIDLLTQRFRRAKNVTGLMVGLLVVVLAPFYQSYRASGRPQYESLNRLQPYRDKFVATKNKLLIGDYADVLSNYLQFDPKFPGTNPPPAVPWSAQIYDYSVLERWDRIEPLQAFLEREGFDFIFIQPRLMSELQSVPASAALLKGDCHLKWTRLNSIADKDWALFGILRDGAVPKDSGENARPLSCAP